MGGVLALRAAQQFLAEVGPEQVRLLPHLRVARQEIDQVRRGHPQRQGGIDYNYRDEPPMVREPAASSGAAQHAAMCGTDPATYLRERPGMSAFALENGVVYHTYSAYARGLDGLWGMYQWLDRAPLGRNETGAGFWWRRHDEYDSQ